MHVEFDPALLAELDALVRATPDATRSRLIREAIRELIRRAAQRASTVEWESAAKEKK